MDQETNHAGTCRNQLRSSLPLLSSSLSSHSTSSSRSFLASLARLASPLRLASLASWCVGLLAALLLCACGQFPRQQKTLTIMSYNVQALFDSVDNGNEYKDYSVEKGLWSEALYRKRLANLVSAITGLCPEKPDILVLQEIENEVVLDDLADALGGYEYRIAAPPGSNAITVGILCRYPVVDAVAHQYQVGQLVKNNARLLLEVRVNIDGIPLIVLAAHWKSKKEGAVATEAERKIAARLARDIITARKHEQPTIGIILAGDLNTNPDEYERVNKAYTTALMPCGSGPGPWLEISGDAAMVTREPLVLYSPWFTSEGYSYCYENTRERIDNFLLTVDFLAPEAPLLFLGFSANPPGFLIDEAGNPLGWNSRTGSGYSDHLPIVLRLQIVQS